MKVCIKLREYETIWDKQLEKLKKYAEVVLLIDQTISSPMDDVIAILTTHLIETDIQNMPNLRKVFLLKTGIDGLPNELLQQKGIDVCPSYANADVISEHAVALALALLHRIVEFDNDLRNDTWFSNGQDYYWSSIDAMRVGILGYGHIGRNIYNRICGFNDQIQVLNRLGKYPANISQAKDLNALLKWSDLLFICLPKTTETIGLIGEKELELLKNKYIVNISRAEICNEQALYEALEKKALKGYASDVWYSLPDKKSRRKKSPASIFPFQDLSNVIMTPHCATHAVGAHEKYIGDAVMQCLQYIKGNRQT